MCNELVATQSPYNMSNAGGTILDTQLNDFFDDCIAGKKTACFPDGTYLFPVNYSYDFGTSSISIQGQSKNGTVLQFQTDENETSPPPPGPVLNFIGTKDTDEALTYTVIKGSNSLYIASHTYLENDLILIHSSETYGEGITQGEIHRITKVDGDFIYFDDYIFDTYLERDTPMVAKIISSSCYIKDITIIQIPSDSLVLNNSAIHVVYGRDCVFENTTIDNTTYAGLYLYSSFSSKVIDCNFYNCNIPENGYGVVVGNACMYTDIYRCNFMGMRHAIRLGGAGYPGVNWETSIRDCRGTVTVDGGNNCFIYSESTGSALIENCTALGGIDKGFKTIPWQDDTPYEIGSVGPPYIPADSVVVDEKLYICIQNHTSAPGNMPPDHAYWSRQSGFISNGYDLDGFGNFIIRNCIAKGFGAGLKVSEEESLNFNLFVDGFYCEECQVGVIVQNTFIDNLHLHNIYASTPPNDEIYSGSILPVVRIDNSTVKSWHFSEIHGYNKPLLDLRENVSIPEDLIIHGGSVMNKGDYPPQHCIDLEKEEKIKFITLDNLQIENAYNVLRTFVPISEPVGSKSLVVRNCNFKTCLYYYFLIYNNIDTVKFLNCEFLLNNTTNTYETINIVNSGIANLHFIDCFFWRLDGSGMPLLTNPPTGPGFIEERVVLDSNTWT